MPMIRRTEPHGRPTVHCATTRDAMAGEYMSDDEQPEPRTARTPAAAEPGRPGTEPRARRARAPAPRPGGPGTARAGKRPKRTGWRRFVPRWRLVLGLFLLCALLLIGGFIAGYTLVTIPPANAVAMRSPTSSCTPTAPSSPRDGEVNRENVTLAQVPQTSSTPYWPPRTGTSTPSAPSTPRRWSAPPGTPPPARAPRAARPSPSSTSRTTTSARNRPSPAR